MPRPRGPDTAAVKQPAPMIRSGLSESGPASRCGSRSSRARRSISRTNRWFGAWSAISSRPLSLRSRPASRSSRRPRALQSWPASDRAASISALPAPCCRPPIRVSSRARLMPRASEWCRRGQKLTARLAYITHTASIGRQRARPDRPPPRQAPASHARATRIKSGGRKLESSYSVIPAKAGIQWFRQAIPAQRE